MALVRAAESEQDAAIYLTAAFTGLRRGELIALRWRDVDFAGCVIRVRASYAAGALTTPKSGKLRSVPMAPQVAETLARLGAHRRPTTRLVFLGEGGGYLDGSRAPPPLQARPRPSRVSAPSASTTSATPSAPARSPRPTSCASRSGWATPTSPRPCATSTTSRAPKTPASSPPPSRSRRQPFAGAQRDAVVAVGRWSGAPRGSGVEAPPPLASCLGVAGPTRSRTPFRRCERARPAARPAANGFPAPPRARPPTHTMYFVAMVRAGGRPHSGPGSSKAAGRAAAEQLVMWLIGNQIPFGPRQGRRPTLENHSLSVSPLPWPSPF